MKFKNGHHSMRVRECSTASRVRSLREPLRPLTPSAPPVARTMVAIFGFNVKNNTCYNHLVELLETASWTLPTLGPSSGTPSMLMANRTSDAKHPCGRRGHSVPPNKTFDRRGQLRAARPWGTVDPHELRHRHVNPSLPPIYVSTQSGTDYVCSSKYTRAGEGHSAASSAAGPRVRSSQGGPTSSRRPAL